MTIDPLKRGPVSPDEVARQAGVQEARREAAAKPRAEGAGPADRVEVSAEARQLAARPVGEAGGSLPPARVREILARVASGYYDRPEVVAAVAGRVARELHGPAEG
jgi:anti-sigma28 factor (negative regulator of flagellin synthesis)